MNKFDVVAAQVKSISHCVGCEASKRAGKPIENCRCGQDALLILEKLKDLEA